MKRLFWILLLLNIVVFAYFKRDALSPAVSSLKPEVHPERIKLLSASALETYPKRTVAPAQDTALLASPPAQEVTPAIAESKPANKKETLKTAESRPATAGVCY
ncbi:MAG: SPOR domain-containing protein, partial [Methylophilus sp.]